MGRLPLGAKKSKRKSRQDGIASSVSLGSIHQSYGSMSQLSLSSADSRSDLYRQLPNRILLAPGTRRPVSTPASSPLFAPIHPSIGLSLEDTDSVDTEEEPKDVLCAREELLGQSAKFDLAHSPERGYRATEMKLYSIKRPHMRAMHASWICFFASGFVQFSMAPLLPQLQISLNLSKRDVWWTNVWMMIGGIPMRFVLGPMCDAYGPREVMVWILIMGAIPCALSGIVVADFPTLLVMRVIMGAMDAFVPCQCWITSHFVREVSGTLMAIAGGLGASGAGFTQLFVGFLFSQIRSITNDDQDLSWRLSLLGPAVFAVIVAYWAHFFSDDCPLGNFVNVKKAGLMMQRSAADSFRDVAVNLNSWILFLQFAGACGVDLTMCNGCAIYFHQHFNQDIKSSGAIAFAYGFAAIYARGIGGYLSDRVYDSIHLEGRLWVHFACMLAQGGLNIWFARCQTLTGSIFIMMVFSIFVQMSMGTCYGVVPYVDSPNTGSVAGVVGAGGNVGAAVLGMFFIVFDYETAMEYMGWFTIAMGLLTPLIVIKGYRGILFGKNDERALTRHEHSPLVVAKGRHSPHLVKIRQRRMHANGRTAIR